MPRPQVHQIDDYRALHKVMRKRADELNISRLVLDEIAGLSPGYTATLLRREASKTAAFKTCLQLVRALGFALVLIEDEAALAAIAPFLNSRHAEKINRVRGRTRRAVLHQEATS